MTAPVMLGRRVVGLRDSPALRIEGDFPLSRTSQMPTISQGEHPAHLSPRPQGKGVARICNS